MTATPQYNGPIVSAPPAIIGGKIFADEAEAQAVVSKMNEFEAEDAADHGSNEYRARYVVVTHSCEGGCAGGFKVGVYDYDSGDLFAYFPPTS